MPLVSQNELSKSLNLDKYGPLGIHISKSLMNILRLKSLNQLYDRYHHLQGLEFVDAILKDLNIEVDISSYDIKRLPKRGPFIIVANHPLGAIDGLIMLKILLSYNRDAKILANFILKNIQPIADCVCAVNPFETRKQAHNSSTGLKQALAQLSAQKPLGLFPAGEVSMREAGFYGKINDKPWELGAIKLIKKAQVPVVPVYFHAQNSPLFYWLSAMNGHLRTASLPSEVIRSKGKTIKVRIGHPIAVSEQNEKSDIYQLGQFLRQKTYLLREPFQHKPKLRLKKRVSSFDGVIGLKSSQDQLIKIFEELKAHGALILSKGNQGVYFTQISAYPELKNELGRLREITFREVGEGTHKALDIDKYDDYYHHLILWDGKDNEIVGAYRMALGHLIYPHYGLKGFYLSELFTMKGQLPGFLNKSIEMGRAFIQKKYQNKPFPLFLLWQGIVAVARRYPEHKYLIGAASISSSYCFYSRSLMVEYLKTYQMDKELSGDIKPKKPFIYKLRVEDKKLLEVTDIKKIDKLIEEIEINGAKIPILIKKYLIHKAKILGFNEDKSFNNAIDVLMYLNIEDIDNEKLGI